MVMIPILPPFWYFLENINLHATQELHIRLELGLAHSHHSGYFTLSSVPLQEISLPDSLSLSHALDEALHILSSFSFSHFLFLSLSLWLWYLWLL